jgi:hypothetical protein
VPFDVFRNHIAMHFFTFNFGMANGINYQEILVGCDFYYSFKM